MTNKLTFNLLYRIVQCFLPLLLGSTLDTIANIQITSCRLYFINNSSSTIYPFISKTGIK